MKCNRWRRSRVGERERHETSSSFWHSTNIYICLVMKKRINIVDAPDYLRDWVSLLCCCLEALLYAMNENVYCSSATLMSKYTHIFHNLSLLYCSLLQSRHQCLPLRSDYTFSCRQFNPRKCNKNFPKIVLNDLSFVKNNNKNYMSVAVEFIECVKIDIETVELSATCLSNVLMVNLYVVFLVIPTTCFTWEHVIWTSEYSVSLKLKSSRVFVMYSWNLTLYLSQPSANIK